MTIWILIGICFILGLATGFISRKWLSFKKRGAFLIAGLIIFASGVIISAYGWHELSWHLAKLSWPSVGAEITNVHIAGERAFHPEVSYRYMVDDSVYSGVAEIYVPGFGGKWKRMDVAQKEAADFSVGDTIYIHYTPSNPRAVYIPEHLTKPILQTGFGLILVLTGAFLIPIVAIR